MLNDKICVMWIWLLNLTYNVDFYMLNNTQNTLFRDFKLYVFELRIKFMPIWIEWSDESKSSA